MTLDSALSTCRLILKQITPEDLTEVGIAAMNSCFSGFTEPLSQDDEYIQEGLIIAAKKLGSDKPIEADLSTPRRFAGDRSLGRGRYFTLCKDSTGNDQGTLTRELRAYHNPLKSGLVTIIDPTLPEHHDLVPLALRGRMLRDLILLFPSIGERCHPFASRFTTEARPVYVTLPLRISETEIERVIDLRKPDVANWFATSLSRLDWFALLPNRKTSFPAFSYKPPLESFGDLLPALFCTSIGGGLGAAQIVGLWLRKLRVNGLVFPSARSDSSVLVRDKEVVEWSGFNFVDYRNSQPPENFASIDFSVGWPLKVQTWPDDFTENAEPIVYDTVNIMYEDQGVNKDSWMVQGLEMRRSASYCFLEVVWLLEQLFSPDDPHAKNVRRLVSDFLHKTWRSDLSSDFVEALLGMPVARERILSFITEPIFDNNSDVRESVRIVLKRIAT